jgi:hypothetical protein
MPGPDFIARNSRFFENLLEQRVLFDLRRHFATSSPPRLLNVLKSEVDAFGFDLVLSISDRAVHVQMKTRSGLPPSNRYDLSDALWSLPTACAVWTLYDAATLEPSSYYVLGFPMPDLHTFSRGSRIGYRGVKMQQANHRRLRLQQLAQLLFPLGPNSGDPADIGRGA